MLTMPSALRFGKIAETSKRNASHQDTSLGASTPRRPPNLAMLERGSLQKHCAAATFKVSSGCPVTTGNIFAAWDDNEVCGLPSEGAASEAQPLAPLQVEQRKKT